MKGVMLQVTDARLVDISHQFPRQDVRAAAFWLREVLPYFPPAVHLVVVDPGVGTGRAALAVRAGGHALVGPDNGVLLPVARELAAGDEGGDGDEESIEVFEVAYENPESATFHGRDVFAPAAALVHEAGIDAFDDHERFTPTEQYDDCSFPTAAITDEEARGEVLVVDDFGNAITNIDGEWLTDRFGGVVSVNGSIAPVRRTYAAVSEGQRLVTVGSHGNVELAVNQGRGDDAFDVQSGDAVTLSF